jgi:hypothetical protein
MLIPRTPMPRAPMPRAPMPRAPMPRTRRTASTLLQGLVLALAVSPGAGPQAQTRTPEAPVRLYRLVTMRGDVLVGLTEHDLAALGSGPEVERIARRISQEGHLTAWRYQVTRAGDGGTRLATRDKVAVLRQDALMVEPYTPALPVAAPPGE